MSPFVVSQEKEQSAHLFAGFNVSNICLFHVIHSKPESRRDLPCCGAKDLYVKHAGLVKSGLKKVATNARFLGFSENNLENLGFIPAGRGWNVFRIA